MILKCTLKNCLINVFDIFFPQLSNDLSSFSKIFHFHLQKVQNMLYLKKCIFNIFLPSSSKVDYFLRRRGYFPKSARDVFCEKQNVKEVLKMKIKNFDKTTYIIGKLRKKYVKNVYQTIFLSTFQYHKDQLEIARFGACSPRAGTVDVKRLI